MKTKYKLSLKQLKDGELDKIIDEFLIEITNKQIEQEIIKHKIRLKKKRNRLSLNNQNKIRRKYKRIKIKEFKDE